MSLSVSQLTESFESLPVISGAKYSEVDEACRTAEAGDHLRSSRSADTIHNASASPLPRAVHPRLRVG